MRTWIEELKSEPEFRSIIRRWPNAVQTSEGVVIPHFDRVSDTASLQAFVTKESIALRPVLETHGDWQEDKRRILRHIEAQLEVTLTPQPATTSVGQVCLEEEWGDFSVWVR